MDFFRIVFSQPGHRVGAIYIYRPLDQIQGCEDIFAVGNIQLAFLHIGSVVKDLLGVLNDCGSKQSNI